MPETTTTFDAVLKDMYIGPVRDTLNEQVTLFNITNAGEEKVGGRRIIYPVHTNRNWGVGSRAERGTLPAALNETYVTATVARKHWYGRLEMSGPGMKSSQGSNAGFAEMTSESFDRLTNTSRRYFNRSLFGIGRGDLGNIATNHATESTASLVTSILATVGVEPEGNPLRFIEAGMVLDSLNASSALTETTTVVLNGSGMVVASATIAASGTATLVFNAGGDGSGTFTVISGGIFVHQGTGWNDFLGLDAGIETSGTYLGISRAARANRGWRGNVLHNNGTNRALSLDLLQKGWDTVSEATGDDTVVTHLMAHYSVRREYIQLLQADVRFTPTELRGGTRRLSFTGGGAEVPFMFEVDAPYNTVYGINARNWHLYKWSEFEWADDDGAVLHRVANIDSFEAFLRIYGNFATDAPRENFRIADIAATL